MWRILVNSYTLIILVRSILLFWPPDIRSIWAILHYTHILHFTNLLFFTLPPIRYPIAFSNFSAFLFSLQAFLISHRSGLGVKPLGVLYFLLVSQSFDSHPYPLTNVKQTITIRLTSSMNMVNVSLFESFRFMQSFPLHSRNRSHFIPHRCSSVAKQAHSLLSFTCTLEHSLSNCPSGNLIASFIQPHHVYHHVSCKLFLASLTFGQRGKPFPLYHFVI